VPLAVPIVPFGKERLQKTVLGAAVSYVDVECIVDIQQREEFERCVDCVSAELCYEGYCRGKKLSAVLTVLVLNCFTRAFSSNMQRNVELVCQLSIW
jgi:hypothetical protein